MGLLKKMASVLVTASLIFGLVGSAIAATPTQVSDAGSRLQELGIVLGDGTGDMKLADPITRAQLMKIMVWAFGQKDNAAILAGANAFPDTASHWASGEIAIAKNIIVNKNHFEMGMPDGNFAPEGKVTAAQAVAFLMKFIGISPDSSKTWPNNYLDAAVSSGMLSAEDRDSIAATANTEATRGLVFYLADVAFSSYPLASGKTVYQTYAKPNGPTITAEVAGELTTTAASVTVSGTVTPDAKSVFVGTAANPITVTNGAFSFSYDLQMGANNIVIGATDIVGNPATAQLTVTRTVGVATTIDAPASVTVVAGETADFAVAVKDAQGNAISGATVAVTSELGTYADGKFTAGTAAKSGTATVTSGELSVNVNVTVSPAALASIKLAPATVDLSAGTSQKFAATGADQYGNEVALTSAPNWSASKGVMGPDGTFGATADATGTVTVTATSGTVSGTATVTVFGTPTKVQIAAPATLVADGKSEVELTATVLDANGNVAKNYNGEVTFTSTTISRAKVKTATVEAVNGVATTTLLAGELSGSTVLSASASGLTATNVSYKVEAQKLTSISMAANPGTINAKSSSNGALTFTMLDQNGNKMLKLPATISVKVTTSDDDIVTLDGLKTKTYSLDAVKKTFGPADNGTRGTSDPGSATLSATVLTTKYADIAINDVTINTILVGDADSVVVDAIDEAAADDASTVTYRLVDFAGNQVTTSNWDIKDVTVTVKRGSYTLTTEQRDAMLANIEGLSYGVGSFDVDWSAAPTDKANGGEWTVKVSVTDVGYATQTASVVAADAEKLSMAASPDYLAANGTASTTLTVKVKDHYGNLVTDGSYDVKIARQSDSDKVTSASAEQTVTTSNGVATLVLTAGTAIGHDYFIASNDDLDDSTEVDIAVDILGAPHQVAFVDGDDSRTGVNFNGTAGEDTEIYVELQDANGHPITYDQGTPVTVEVFSGDTSLGTWTGSTEDGLATVNVNLTKATSKGFKVVATSGDLDEDNLTNGLFIDAADPTVIALSVDMDTIAAVSGGDESTATVTVQLKDEFGNKDTTTEDTVYLRDSVSTANAGKYGHLVGTELGADEDYEGYIAVGLTNGVGDITFTSGTNATTVTITAESPDYEEGSVTVTTVVVGDADGLTVAEIEDTTVDAPAVDAANVQEITVSVVDGAGHVLTYINAANGYSRTISINAAEVKAALGSAYVEIYTDVDGDGNLVAGTSATIENGSATFYVVSKKADDVDYTFTYVPDSSITEDATGTFVAGEAHHANVQDSDPFTIQGDGIASTGVSAEIVDEFDNLVSDFTGTMKFKIKVGSDYAKLQETEAPIVDGVATVIAKSKDTTDNGDVYVIAGYDKDEDGIIADSEYTAYDSHNPTFYVNVEDPTVIDSVYLDGSGLYVILFSESMEEIDIDDSVFVFENTGDTFGTDAEFEWAGNGFILQVTLGTGATITGDVYFTPNHGLTDLAGNDLDFDTDEPLPTGVLDWE